MNLEVLMDSAHSAKLPVRWTCDECGQSHRLPSHLPFLVKTGASGLWITSDDEYAYWRATHGDYFFIGLGYRFCNVDCWLQFASRQKWEDHEAWKGVRFERNAIPDPVGPKLLKLGPPLRHIVQATYADAAKRGIADTVHWCEGWSIPYAWIAWRKEDIDGQYSEDTKLASYSERGDDQRSTDDYILDSYVVCCLQSWKDPCNYGDAVEAPRRDLNS